MYEEHYEVLDVDEDATLEELRAAYEQAVKEVHPDRNDSPQAVEQFKRVQEAYDTLRRVHTSRDRDGGPPPATRPGPPERSPDGATPATDPNRHDRPSTGQSAGGATTSGDASEATGATDPSRRTSPGTGGGSTAAGRDATRSRRTSAATTATAASEDGHGDTQAHRSLLESVLVALIAPFAIVAILLTELLFSRRAAVVGIPTALGYLVAAYQIVSGTASSVTYLLGVAVLAVMLARINVGVFASVTVGAVVGGALVAGVGITVSQAALVLALIPPVLLGGVLWSAT